MALWAIIPVKPFRLGKSRLADALDTQEREALNRRLFDCVFHAASLELGPGRIAVVSADSTLLARARERGAHGVREDEGCGLNAALALASDYARAHGAAAVLALPSDLPDIAGADIAAMGAALAPPRSCVVAPDACGEGTNALALTPPCADFYRFGARSFAAHSAEAAKRGLALRVVRRPGLANDLDTPEDYRRWLQRERATA
jgi:2-phospho-L-lactate guanylyltransferase